MRDECLACGIIDGALLILGSDWPSLAIALGG